MSFYGDQIAGIRNSIAVGLSQNPSHEVLLRAQILSNMELLVLLSRHISSRSLHYVDDVNESDVFDHREKFIESLVQNGWAIYGLSDPAHQLDGLKVPELKALARRVLGDVPSQARKALLIEKLRENMNKTEECLPSVVGRRVFSLSVDTRDLIEGKFVQTLPVPAVVRPDPSVAADTGWYRVRKTSSAIPFKFRPEHPSNIKIPDFALWAAFSPVEAREIFSEALLRTFDYSWKSLLPFSGTVPGGEGAAYIAAHPESFKVLLREFYGWGGVLFHLWRAADERGEPSFYKVTTPAVRQSVAGQHWLWTDGRTPRVYRFRELAQQEREIVDPYDLQNESDEDDDAESLVLRRGFKVPNFGIQWPDDDSILMLLPRGWGFNVSGSLSFIGPNHDEWVRQHS